MSQTLNINHEMVLILGRFNQLYTEKPTREHCTFCCLLAEEFDLWTGPEHNHSLQFPIWLSRVVAGWIQDREETSTPQL